jgi:DNA-binding response OmpR family regulator
MKMKPKKIFIIEDDESVQKILKLMFEKAGYEIEISADGSLVYKEHQHWPDLFLLDKHIIGRDGLDICRYLKSKTTTRQIPVIMLSATPGIEPLARDAGADDFLEKPFNSLALMLKVKEFLKEPF